ncbi:carboxypeptidase-like regulatory domain-containing protein [Ulvibacterium sp.]|uniref:carboxypeptidase-like regulatory domain-containing protein n=1 Tax=Ulvibacterium sp. TaxID=2665914 RepID=UPI002624BF57|nr:carboxypeptidase-like regulatory domain-containing protein [Ulvibacterium sp.]
MVSKCDFFIIWLLSFSWTCGAQTEYEGQVIDAETGNPISYVNIGIVAKSIGTVSNGDGIFRLQIDARDLEGENSVLFSCLGYRTLEVPLARLKSLDREYPKVKMEPEALELNEVVVTNVDGRFIKDNVGYPYIGDEIFGYWKDNIALGGELATRILVKKGPRILKRITFEIISNPSDSILVRVNFYDDDGKLRLPGTNLNKSGKNILCTIPKGPRSLQVDLKDFNIQVDDNFIASLELLQIYGRAELGLVVAGTRNISASYRKYSSQDKWEEFSNKAMAYHLETSFKVHSKAADKYETRQQRKLKRQRTVSGFVFKNGRMVPSVQISNLRTREQTTTDEKGRYIIRAKKGDILVFNKKGHKEEMKKVSDRPVLNAVIQAVE